MSKMVDIIANNYKDVFIDIRAGQDSGKIHSREQPISELTQKSTSTTINNRADLQPFGLNKPRSKMGSNISSKSSPHYANSFKRTTPNKILGDFHMQKINKVFENF